MSSPVITSHATSGEFNDLREIESRVLWLSTAIVHYANRVRPKCAIIHSATPNPAGTPNP